MNEQVHFHEFCYYYPFRNEKDNNNSVEIYKVDESDTAYFKTKKFCIPGLFEFFRSNLFAKSGNDD